MSVYHIGSMVKTMMNGKILNRNRYLSFREYRKAFRGNGFFRTIRFGNNDNNEFLQYGVRTRQSFSVYISDCEMNYM